MSHVARGVSMSADEALHVVEPTGRVRCLRAHVVGVRTRLVCMRARALVLARMVSME